MKRLLVIFLLACTVEASDYTIDSSRLPSGGTWAGVGVTGGIDQYRPGGVNARPSGSGTTITITSAIPGSALIASGSTTTTTGSISAGSNQLTVASPTSFSAHMGLNLKGAIETVRGVIGTGATSSGNLTITINSTPYTISVVAGDTAIQVRDKIVTGLAAAGTVTAGNENYNDHPAWSCATVAYDANTAHSTWSAGSTGVVSNSGHDSFTVSYADFITLISSVNGSVLTLADNAIATVAGLPVWHEDSQAFIAANNGAVAGSVVYMPNGTYRITTLNDVRQFNPKSDITWRGQSKAGTIWIPTGWPPIETTNGNFGSPITITGGATKGSRTLSLADASGVAVGKMIQITQLNPAYVRYNANYWSIASWVGHDINRLMSIMLMVTARDTVSNPNTITIDRPLPINMTDTPQITVCSTLTSKVGFEDLTIDCSGCSPGLRFFYANDCWVYNVLFKTMVARSIWFSEVTNCTVKHCDFSGHYVSGDQYGANHENLDFYENCCWNIVEDCWFYDAGFTPFMWGDWQGGCVGNAFVYNYQDSMTQLADNGSGPMAIDINHGAWNMFNLVEGNYVENISADGYYAGDGYCTIARNRVTGWFSHNSTYLDHAAIVLSHWSVYENVVGNILGTSGHSTIYQASGYTDFQAPHIYRLGYATSGSRAGGDTFLSNPASSSAGDSNVEATLVRVGNYNYVNNAIPAGETLGGTTVPNSYIYASKPAWFGSLTWPAFDPANPSANAMTQVPAGYRYINGQDPPAEGDTTRRVGFLVIH
jgi:hypothetical protein